MEALDEKNHSVSLFIDMSKAFDSVDYNILIKLQIKCGFSDHAVGQSINYLTDGTQATKLVCIIFNFLSL